MQALWQDLRYGLRTVLRSPGVTALAVLALALGIGANTAVFSVADAFLRKPVSFPDLDRLVTVMSIAPHQENDWNEVSPADYLDWKNQNRSFEPMAAYEWDQVNITGNGDPQLVNGFQVSANFFDTLLVKPAMGRVFLPEEEQPGRDHEVILGYALWQRRFGGDSNVLGKTLTVDGASYMIVGVMGNDFEFPASAQLWLPLAMKGEERTLRTRHYVTPVARLKPGVSISEAQAEMQTIEGRIQGAYPQTDKGWGVRVYPMRYFAAGTYTVDYTKILLWAVLLVLLIACANVANLQLARSTARQREFAVRAALGASRWRLVRQLLTESVLLALAGAGVGLLLGQWGIELILSNMPPEVSRYISGWKEIRLDYAVFVYTLAIAVLAGVVAGLAPALQCSRLDLNEELKEGARGSTAGRARHRLRNIFVVAQIALSLVLVIGAGLMTKGVRTLLGQNQNFAANSILTMRIQLPDSKYKETPQQSSFYEQVLRNLKAVPGVRSAAVATTIPYGNSALVDQISIEGLPKQAGEFRFTYLQSISPDYFRMLNIPLRNGREFADRDGAEAPSVAIVSEDLAQRYWPGQNPLGKRLKRGLEDSKFPWATVVGVVGDVKYDPFNKQDFPAAYFSYRQVPHQYSYIALRTEGDPTSFVPAVRSQIAAVDPNQPIFDIFTLRRVIHNQVLGLSYVAVMLSVMGVIAVILASVGVYGVMAYSVAERTHEIGVRMALGAQPRDVLRMVLRRGVALTAIGLGIGLPISLVLARFLASLLFGVSASDSLTFVGITALLTAVALLSCYLPARRATQVDPLVALRYE